MKKLSYLAALICAALMTLSCDELGGLLGGDEEEALELDMSTVVETTFLEYFENKEPLNVYYRFKARLNEEDGGRIALCNPEVLPIPISEYQEKDIYPEFTIDPEGFQFLDGCSYTGPGIYEILASPNTYRDKVYFGAKCNDWKYSHPVKCLSMNSLSLNGKAQFRIACLMDSLPTDMELGIISYKTEDLTILSKTSTQDYTLEETREVEGKKYCIVSIKVDLTKLVFQKREHDIEEITPIAYYKTAGVEISEELSNHRPIHSYRGPQILSINLDLSYINPVYSAVIPHIQIDSIESSALVHVWVCEGDETYTASDVRKSGEQYSGAVYIPISLASPGHKYCLTYSLEGNVQYDSEEVITFEGKTIDSLMEPAMVYSKAIVVPLRNVFYEGEASSFNYSPILYYSTDGWITTHFVEKYYVSTPDCNLVIDALPGTTYNYRVGFRSWDGKVTSSNSYTVTTPLQ